jgi:hypothetical protein
MPGETNLREQVFEEARGGFNKLEPELAVCKDAPSIAPDHLPYTFENGTTYELPASAAGPFIPDRGFDGPA